MVSLCSLIITLLQHPSFIKCYDILWPDEDDLGDEWEWECGSQEWSNWRQRFEFWLDKFYILCSKSFKISGYSWQVEAVRDCGKVSTMAAKWKQ